MPQERGGMEIYMKGSEIINHITRDKMPDIEQIRERCMNRSNHARGSGFRTRPMRFSTAAALVIAFFVFSTAAYAIGSAIYQRFDRFDTGGRMDIVLLPDDDYGRQVLAEWRETFTVGTTLYYSRASYVNEHRDGVTSRFASVPGTEQVLGVGVIEARHVQAVREMLAGKIFTAEGNEIDFELIVPTTEEMRLISSRYNNRYYIYDRGNTLYTADGYAIGAIHLHSSYPRIEPVRVTIITEAELDYFHLYTYDEAAYFLGSDFRVPVAHVEMFQPLIINIHRSVDLRGHVSEFRGISLLFNIHEIHPRREWCSQPMSIIIERIRDEYSNAAHTQYGLGGEIVEHDMAGVTVHEIITLCVFGIFQQVKFSWIYDGLVYTLRPSPALTHEQTMDVIRSMIE